MLDLLFYAKGKKTSNEKIYEWAKIFSKESDYEEEWNTKTKNIFIKNDITIDGIKVFINKNDQESLLRNLLSLNQQEIIKIIKDKRPEAILVSKTWFLNSILQYSECSEMKPKVTLTKDGTTIIYYALIGEDKCAMFIALDPTLLGN